MEVERKEEKKMKQIRKKEEEEEEEEILQKKKVLLPFFDIRPTGWADRQTDKQAVGLRQLYRESRC